MVTGIRIEDRAEMLSWRSQLVSLSHPRPLFPPSVAYFCRARRRSDVCAKRRLCRKVSRKQCVSCHLGSPAAAGYQDDLSQRRRRILFCQFFLLPWPRLLLFKSASCPCPASLRLAATCNETAWRRGVSVAGVLRACARLRFPCVLFVLPVLPPAPHRHARGRNDPGLGAVVEVADEDGGASSSAARLQEGSNR